MHGINNTGDTTLTATNGVANTAHGAIALDCQTAAMPCVGGRVTLQVPSRVLVNGGTIRATARGSTVSLQGNLTNTGTLQIDDSLRYDQGPVPSGVTLDNRGTIALADGSTLSTGQTVTNGAGGAINATGSGVLSTTGTFNQGAGTTSGTPPIVDGGALNFTGAGASTFVVQHAVALSGNIASSQAITVHGINFTGNTNVTAAAGFTNAGRITIDCQSPAMPCAGGFSTLDSTSGTLVNSGTIIFAARGSTARLFGNLANTGTVQVHDQAVFGQGGATFDQTAGITTVAAGANLDVSTSAGPLELGGGQLNGSGTITGAVDNSGGQVDLGASAITVTGDYTQHAGGSLNIDVTGSGAGQSGCSRSAAARPWAGRWRCRRRPGTQQGRSPAMACDF
ncbi:MAG: hypothetical protein M3065_17135 [Actinomycetota bacterium]|nr:hypothetical protein [Actinomycetota bacterium]